MLKKPTVMNIQVYFLSEAFVNQNGLKQEDILSQVFSSLL